MYNAKNSKLRNLLPPNGKSIWYLAIYMLDIQHKIGNFSLIKSITKSISSYDAFIWFNWCSNGKYLWVVYSFYTCSLSSCNCMLYKWMWVCPWNQQWTSRFTKCPQVILFLHCNYAWANQIVWENKSLELPMFLKYR
jgi:hypothetical protein